MKKSFIKVSAPKRNFICALCSSHRKLKYSKNLTPKHFVQIFVLTLAFASLSWSALGISSLIALPVIWMTFEFTNKVLYRKDIPCPHCGQHPL